jgi:hypothetical protein
MSKELTTCPRCHSGDVRTSYSKKILDLFFSWVFDKAPFRCRNCRLRFYLREPEENTEYLRCTASVKRWTERLRNHPK